MRAVVGDCGTGGHRQVVADGALEGVRQRQKRQHQIVLEHVEQLQCRLDVEKNIAMTEHHALGPSGRAGGVDDRGQAVGFAGLAAVVCGLFIKPVVERDEVVGGGGHGLQTQHAPQTAKLFMQSRQPLPLCRRLDHQHAGARVFKDPGNILGAVVGVDRHRHQPEALSGLVTEHPLPAVAAHDGDAVAGLQAVITHGSLPTGHGVARLPPGLLAPFTVAILHVGQAVGRAYATFVEQIGEGGRIIHRDYMAIV